MKVFIAHPEMSDNNGVGQVLKYHKLYLPQVGIELVKTVKQADIVIDHLGVMPGADIHFSHGLWFGKVNDNQAGQNANIITAIKQAKAVIVPSNYVAETFRRDARISPHVIGHGVQWEAWQKKLVKQDVILWNKNRPGDVCDPRYVTELAKLLPEQQFVTTFANEKLANVIVTGVLTFAEMQKRIMSSCIYLATTKETFGIGTLEAMASGAPVIGFAWGGTKGLITQGKDGYLVAPGDVLGLVKAVEYVKMNYAAMSKAAKSKAKKYSWLEVAKKIKGVCDEL